MAQNPAMQRPTFRRTERAGQSFKGRAFTNHGCAAAKFFRGVDNVLVLEMAREHSLGRLANVRLGQVRMCDIILTLCCDSDRIQLG